MMFYRFSSLSPSSQKKEPPRVDARERQIVVEKTEGLKVQPHELGFLKFGNGGELTQVFWRMRS